MDAERVVCNTPTPGKMPTRILRWKYDLIRQVILEIMAEHEDGLLFKDLADAVAQRLPETQRRKLGSIGWYTTTVKLDLEVRGELSRHHTLQGQKILPSEAARQQRFF